MTTAFQADAFQVTGFQIDSGVVVVIPDVAPSAGNWDKLLKKKKRKAKTIRFSDFDSREEYAKALAALAMPIVRHEDPVEDDDDHILMALVTRILH